MLGINDNQGIATRNAKKCSCLVTIFSLECASCIVDAIAAEVN